MGSKVDKGRQSVERGRALDVARNAGAAGDRRHADRHAEVDDEILRRCKEGDSRAVRVFVDTYKDRIASFLRWLKRPAVPPSDVEDIAQEVFCRVLDRGRRGSIAFFVPPSAGGAVPVSSWLFEIARRLVIDWQRRRGRQVKTGPSDEPHDARSSALAPRDHERAEDRQALQAAMAGLSEKHREVLFLREVQGKSYKEIARICGIPENTVKSRLMRAREGLRRNWKGNNDEQEGESRDG
jgi:RNA polymerase sigma factor (sigma-70 family)